MKVALVSIIKPIEGSGDGTTEYAYQLYAHIKERIQIELIYALEESKRNNIMGLLYANTLFKKKIIGLLKKDYDIIHITSQELGFLARIIKKKNKKIKIITTIHDLSRFKNGIHSGMFQGTYNKIVRKNIIDAVKYSDYLLFVSSQTEEEVEHRFRAKIKNKWKRVILQGISEKFIDSNVLDQRKEFRVGYLGSLAEHKNVILVMKAANELKNEKDILFDIYGTGITYKKLLDYRKRYELKNTRLRGFGSEEKIVEMYDTFNVFLFPSLYEGFGRPILEAQARGLPVVIYQKGEIPEETRKYCLVAKDERDMAQIIERIKEKGYDKKSKKMATDYARSFTWKRTIEETLKAYRKMM